MSAPALVLFTVTDTDGVAHLIAEDAMAAGRRAGRYLAVCGTQVLAASLMGATGSAVRQARVW